MGPDQRLHRIVRHAFAHQATEAIGAVRRGVVWRPGTEWDRLLASSAELALRDGIGGGRTEEGAKWGRRKSYSAPVWKRQPGGVATAPALRLMPGQGAPEVAEAARRMAFDFARSVNATTAERLQEAYREFRRELVEWAEKGEAINALAQRIKGIVADPNRALLVARTEGRRATEAGRLLAAREAPIPLGKRWVASDTACPVCLALAKDRRPRPLDEPFAVDPKGGVYAVCLHAPRHPGCFCSVAFVPL